MAEQKQDGPHPRREPRFPGPLTLEGVEQIFEGCSDFAERTALLHNDPQRQVTLCYINGMVRGERINDYLLRPLAQDPRLSAVSEAEAFQLLGQGALYNLYVERRTTLDQAAVDLTMGWCVLFFPGRMDALSFFVGTEEKRAVGQSENEPALKGARDSFVESILTNTSLVRRRLRAPELKIAEVFVGRQSVTPVDILYLQGTTNPDLVRQVKERIAAIDTDEMFQTAALEELIADKVDTPFPLLAYTERPDRFCAGLVEGRVGVFVDGIPLGYLLPGTVGQFFKTGQDRAQNWVAASFLSVLRYLCMLGSLFLPAWYVAAVNFHPEMIPARLAWSIAEAKANVPFSTVFEVLIMLLAFEAVQEAGLRLPGPIGQTASILGGLVVGSAAVEAAIVSPVVLIVVAMAGIAGYTVPSQEFSAALRIWRFGLAIAASLGGLFAVTALAAVLVGRLARMESFGVPYLTPFAAAGGERARGHGVIRWPVHWVKFRETALRTENQRRQG